MKPRLTVCLLWAVALLGGTGGYFAISCSLAQTTDRLDTEAPAVATTDAKNTMPSGNPLWTIPLEQLVMFRERPIFSPSRRPPPPVVTPVYVAPPPPPPPPKEPERPAISLVGTVASASEAIGVFLETTTRNTVRLRIGEDHDGWVLRSIKGRDATIEKGSESAVLELAPPGGSGDPAVAGIGQPVRIKPQP